MSTSQSILRFFGNTDPAYIEKCLEQRNPGPNAAGSVFAEPQTSASLIAASWEPYDHPAVQAPAKAYKAPIGGNLGVVSLVDLGDPAIELTLDDRKGTGNLSVVYTADVGIPVKHTTLLIGPDRDDPNKEVVWTFFPGDPITPSMLKAGEDYQHGDKITVGEAIYLGFEFAKVVQM